MCAIQQVPFKLQRIPFTAALCVCVQVLKHVLCMQVRVESNKAMDLLVMENVFYERSLAPVYDLKGSERARWCKDDPADPTTVLLDENLKRDILSAPLLVSSSALMSFSDLRRLSVEFALVQGQFGRPTAVLRG